MSLNSRRDCEMVVLDEVSSGALTSLSKLVVEAGAVEMPLAPSCRVTLAVGIDRGSAILTQQPRHKIKNILRLFESFINSISGLSGK